MAFKKIVKSANSGGFYPSLSIAKMEGSEGAAIFESETEVHIVVFDKKTKKYYTVKKLELRAEDEGLSLVTVLEDEEYSILES
jgi:hypothetical protein